MEHNFRIRTITAFVSLTKQRETWKDEIRKAANFLKDASQTYQCKNYEVQTIRMATNNFYEYMDVSSTHNLIEDVKYFEAICANEGIFLVCIGGAVSLGDFLSTIVILENSTSIFANVQITSDTPLAMAAEKAAYITQKVADRNITNGSFRFTICTNCVEGIPFFPAAFKQDATSNNYFSIGTENTELLHACLSQCSGLGQDAVEVIREGFDKAFEPVCNLAKQVAAKHNIEFRGVDPSIAPGLDTPPITDSFELLLPGKFGCPGTLALCSMITEGLKTLKLKLCGYKGLMLPVCEDHGLAAYYSKELIGLCHLLQYSSVCGVGFDTVPIPSNVSIDYIQAVIMDVCRLSTKLSKPLSCRLLLCLHKKAGEQTDFNSPYLVECTLPNI